MRAPSHSLEPPPRRFGGASRPWKYTKIPVRASGTSGAARRTRPAWRDDVKVSWPGRLSLGSYKGSPYRSRGRQLETVSCPSDEEGPAPQSFSRIPISPS